MSGWLTTTLVFLPIAGALLLARAAGLRRELALRLGDRDDLVGQADRQELVERLRPDALERACVVDLGAVVGRDRAREQDADSRGVLDRPVADREVAGRRELRR